MEEQPQAPPQGPPRPMTEAERLKIEITKLRKRLNQIEPQVRSRKEDQNINTLFALKSAGKDVVNVGWANSATSAQEQFDKFPDRYQGWTVDEKMDIDGDGQNDTVIFNASSQPKIINGQTIKKSQHPFRKGYYEQYPTRESRTEVNKQIKEQGLPSMKQRYNSLKVIHNKDGTVNVEYNFNNDRKSKLSTYKVFTKLYFNPIWDGIKHVYKEYETTEKLKVYGQLLRSLWQVLQAETLRRLGLPEGQITEEVLGLYTGKKAFKDTLAKIVEEILIEPSNFAEATIMTLSNLDQSLLVELQQNMPKIIKSMRVNHHFVQ